MPYNPKVHRRKSIRLKGYDYTQVGYYFITICCHGFKHRFGAVIGGKMHLNECGEIAKEVWMKLPERFPRIDLDTFVIMPNHMHAILPIVRTSTIEEQRNLPPPNTPQVRTALAGVPPQASPAGVLLESPPAGVPPQAPLVGVRKKASLKRLLPQEGNLNGIGEGGAINETPTRGVGTVVGAYKSLVFKDCLRWYKSQNRKMGKFWLRNYYEHIIRDERAYHNISNYIKNNPRAWGKDKFK